MNEQYNVAVEFYESGDFLLKEVRVEIEDRDTWATEPPKREYCPPTFRCYCCQRKLKASEYGGSRRGKRFCLICVPYLDDFDAGRMIWKDHILGFDNGVSHIHEKSDVDGLPKFPHMSEEVCEQLINRHLDSLQLEAQGLMLRLWLSSTR